MERKEYSLAEVAQHNGNGGQRLWLVIAGGVYDVTDYAAEHPGGAELLAEYAGMDATSAFTDVGHSSDAKKIMKKYAIGVLVQAEKGKNNKSKQVSKRNVDKDSTSISGQSTKQRRKFLSLILGPCASS